MSVQAKTALRIGVLCALITGSGVGCTPEQINAATQIMSATVTPMVQAPTQQTPTQQVPAQQSPMSAQRGQLTLNKQNFKVGEQIQVSFRAPAGLHRSAWIGIIPSNIPHGDEEVNDSHDITYQYLEGRTSGTFVFTAPSSGYWDLRMHSTDTRGIEIASVSFTTR